MIGSWLWLIVTGGDAASAQEGGLKPRIRTKHGRIVACEGHGRVPSIHGHQSSVAEQEEGRMKGGARCGPGQAPRRAADSRHRQPATRSRI